MSEPLVSRPPYGEGRPRTPTAEAKLPEGGPAHRGLPLDDSIPGYKTFVKPLDDNGTSGEDDKDKDESIYRVDNPRDLTKSPDRIDVVDQTDSTPQFMGLGKPDKSPKTKYPYRDGIPNAHNASVVDFVVGVWQLRSAADLRLPAGVRVAATLDTIMHDLGSDVQQRSNQCVVLLKRADVPNMRWFFAVNCGNGPKIVRLKAGRLGNTTQFSKLDLHMACSCPAWRWQGPEYHAKNEVYQDPKTPLQGTASTPNIRDPERIHKVCKHVAAVVSFTRGWSVPVPKKK